MSKANRAAEFDIIKLVRQVKHKETKIKGRKREHSFL